MILKKLKIKTLLLISILPVTVCAYNYDPNDFATSYEYYAGTGAGYYIYPDEALGRPSIDTDYFGSLRPVVPVYPQWLPTEIVTIGRNGYLILKFNHKVADDENNPYGIDFIIFGNAMQAVDPLAGQDWDYQDPCNVLIKTGHVNTEFGRVSVSQDGFNWYPFDDGPFADSFAPTLGRIYDTNDPNTGYAGWDNLWWAKVTNPTIPFDPNIDPNNFEGATVAEMSQEYGESAGGTGFDLRDLDPNDFNDLQTDPNSNRKWIQYIKIECTSISTEDSNLPEIDAVSDVAACGDYKHPYPTGDINKNCIVSFGDLKALSDYWLNTVTDQNEPQAEADLYQDGFIDFRDFAILTEYWDYCSWKCN